MASDHENDRKLLFEFLLSTAENRLPFQIEHMFASKDPFHVTIRFSTQENSVSWVVDRSLFEAIASGAKRVTRNRNGVEIQIVRDNDIMQITLYVVDRENGSLAEVYYTNTLDWLKGFLDEAMQMDRISIDHDLRQSQDDK